MDFNRAKSYTDRVAADFVLGEITDGSLTDVKLSNASSSIKQSVLDMAINPNSCTGATDSDKIDAAISLATTLGKRVVMIPQISAINGDNWIIDRAILLPSNFLLILDNCTVLLGTGVQDNIITNSGARGTLAANQNIHIRGIGNATLDGGTVSNFTIPGIGYNDYHRVSLLLFNTQGFSIEGVKIVNSQGWSISIENNCYDGRIKNITFNSPNTWANQDGIDIRKGCHDILIEDIYGRTGDDVIALTGIYYEDAYGNSFQVGGNTTWGVDDDIYNITIKNIRAETTYHIIRLLVQNTIQMYNIDIDGVYDSSTKFVAPTASDCIWIGDTDYYQSAPNIEQRVMATKDDMFNIKIKNVISRANNTITFMGQCKQIAFENIHGNWDFVRVFNFATDGTIEDVTVDGASINRYQAASYDGTPYEFADWTGQFAYFGSTCNLIRCVMDGIKIVAARNIFHFDQTTSPTQVDLTIKNLHIMSLSHRVFFEEFVINDLNNKTVKIDSITYKDTTDVYKSNSSYYGLILTNTNIVVANLLVNKPITKDIASIITLANLVKVSNFHNTYTLTSDGKVRIVFRLAISDTSDDITISSSTVFTLPETAEYKAKSRETGFVIGVKASGTLVPIMYLTEQNVMKFYNINGGSDTFKSIGGTIEYYNSL